MGFTNVAWESRGTEQLARDLTTGPGSVSIGQAGAAWVRIGNELASVSQDFDRTVEKVKASFASAGADAAVDKLDAFTQWLQAASISAAANGQRSEEAAVAYSVAVLAMPSESEAMVAKTQREIMASLAAYNGAILNGQFAEFDEATDASHGTASSVMYQYEAACEPLATAWDQPLPPDVSNGAALRAERADKAGAQRPGGAGVGAGAHKLAAIAPPPLMPFQAGEANSSRDAVAPKTIATSATAASGAGVGPGGGYGPMGAALGRSSASREYQSFVQPGVLEGGGEPGANLSQSAGSWLPTAQQSDAPFTVSAASWGPSTALFDDLGAPDAPESLPYADEPQRALEQLSDRWVSAPVIGADKGPTL